VEPLSLFGELKRRRVIRALVGYGIAAFAVLQIIEPVMHGFHWPDEILSYVVVARGGLPRRSQPPLSAAGRNISRRAERRCGSPVKEKAAVQATTNAPPRLDL
jgi:hypothetical protein